MKFEQVKEMVNGGDYVELSSGLYAVAKDAEELDKVYDTDGFVWHTNDGIVGTIDTADEWEEFKKEHELFDESKGD